MNETLSELKSELVTIISRIDSLIPSIEPMSIAHANWSFPGITKIELIDQAQELIDILECVNDDQIQNSHELLEKYKKILKYLSDNTIPNIWGTPDKAISAYIITLNGFKRELNKFLKTNHSTDLHKVVKQIRTLEARLKQVEPKTTDLKSMVERIEQAYSTAEQLPADMELLNESRDKIKDTIIKTGSDAERIADIKEKSGTALEDLRKMKQEAEDVLKRCETAYAASTSVGLAAAFSERSNTLSKSMWFWIFGLIIALITAASFGSFNIYGLLNATGQAEPSISLITIRIFLSILSIGGPVWFAWLATKQIGQRFRLSEDYAFKASISRAYEGFRSEAARIDKNLEVKLLASALSRFDELPLRLVETETHGSPYHELLSSDKFKQALKIVPELSDQIKDLVEKALNTASPVSKTATKVTSKTASTDKTEQTASS